MLKPDSLVTAVLVALAIFGALTLSFSASAQQAASGSQQFDDRWYYQHTGGVPPQ